MHKDPTSTVFTWLLAVAIGAASVFVVGIIVLPFVAVGLLIWLTVKWYKANQAKANAKSRDALLREAVANPVPVPAPLQFAKNFFLAFAQSRKDKGQDMPAYVSAPESMSIMSHQKAWPGGF